MADLIEVTICNWDELYKPRKDVKSMHWFKMYTNFYRDPKWYHLTNDHRMVWVALLTIAADLMSKTITISPEMISTQLGMTPKAVREAIQAIAEDIQCITQCGQTLTSICIDKRREDKRRKEKRREDISRPEGLPIVAELWNKHSNAKLPKVRSMSRGSKRYRACVTRWAEHPDEQYWIDAIKKIDAIPGLLGENERGWMADIEFFTRPDMASQLLEGKYSNWGRGPQTKGIAELLAEDEANDTN